jgi:predicted heme/steroid binding protein
VAPTKKNRVVTKEELAKHAASEDSTEPVWLAIMGQVFDVSKAPKYYGVEGGYRFFTGLDGTRAFVTGNPLLTEGEFNSTGLREDVDGLTADQCKSIKEWTDFYHKDYVYVGRLAGKWYDESGSPTTYYYKIQKKVSAH